MNAGWKLLQMLVKSCQECWLEVTTNAGWKCQEYWLGSCLKCLLECCYLGQIPTTNTDEKPTTNATSNAWLALICQGTANYKREGMCWGFWTTS